MTIKTIKTTRTVETVETVETVDGALPTTTSMPKAREESSYQRTVRALVKRALLEKDFRREFLTDPRGVYASESGKKLPDGFALRVLEDAINIRHVVLPHIEQVEELSDDELDAISSGVFHARTCQF